MGAIIPMLIGLAACGGGPDADMVRAEGVSMRVVSPADASALGDIVNASRAVGTTVLSGADRENNVVVSPASLASALAMLTEGAQGATLSDLEAALGATGEDRRDAFAALRAVIGEFDGDPSDATGDELPENALIHLANRLVVHDDFEVRDEFLRALADGFGTGVQRADLTSAASKKVLDEWVKHHTGGLISKSAIEPNADLRLVIQDAVLFAARWATPFESAGTVDLPFTLGTGGSVAVPTMSIHDEPFAYADLTDGWVAVRLPYTSGAVADVLLPPAGTDPAEASPELLAEAAQKLGAAQPAPASVWLPTIDFKDKIDLIQGGAIGGLGIGSILCGNPDVDLSGIALSPGDLCVQQAAQQVVLRVNEAGTIAAAVTELGVFAGSAPMEAPQVREIRFDRPFLFTINHDSTGWPLFYAAIRDPR
ncbi:serpin family protein [Rarobacter faecitabidus]|uniref:Serpin B n=1 Tax=Rarobacter faecitabidus TaxID=13243 RepID=A0A542ZWL4_RARFA|nr:serpin family protein [Rarobacter faecitabidus]TQL64722.1 serpin B [Rarobacter faecitabidus]